MSSFLVLLKSLSFAIAENCTSMLDESVMSSRDGRAVVPSKKRSILVCCVRPSVNAERIVDELCQPRNLFSVPVDPLKSASPNVWVTRAGTPKSCI